jgi:type II secretory pathway predicted ATPase ExeA
VSFNYSKSTTSRSEGETGARSVVSFQPQSGALTYEPYFGLSEKPFSLTADPRFVYDSPAYVTTYQRLLAGIRRREGLLVLTGQIGTGKTTLCRAVLRDLGRNIHSSLVPDPFASREDLLKMLLIDFGALSIQELTTGPLRQASRTELGYLLGEFLNSLSRDTFVVAIIDEAQNLSLPLIEETRILSDTFGASGRMQIVFVGQPELHGKLKLPEMRQVDQRVSGYHRLSPLSREAVAGYIQHRLQVAGADRNRVLFPPSTVDVLYQRSGGVPRLINRVCDRALQIAFERKTDSVDREILDTALIEVGSATLSPNWDSIIFEQPQPSAAPAAPASAPVAASLPAISAAAPTTAAPAVPAAPAAPTSPSAPPPSTRSASQIAALIGADENFKKRVDYWVEQDLATSSRPLPSSTAPARNAERRTPRPNAPARTVTTDWPRDVRPETYLQRLWRKWMKIAAIAIGVMLALNLAMASAALLVELMKPPVLPVLPEAPAPALPDVALPLSPPDSPA